MITLEVQALCIDGPREEWHSVYCKQGVGLSTGWIPCVRTLHDFWIDWGKKECMDMHELIFTRVALEMFTTWKGMEGVCVCLCLCLCLCLCMCVWGGVSSWVIMFGILPRIIILCECNTVVFCLFFVKNKLRTYIRSYNGLCSTSFTFRNYKQGIMIYTFHFSDCTLVFNLTHTIYY